MHAAGLTNGSILAIWTDSNQAVLGQVFHRDATAPGGTSNDTGVIPFSGVQVAAHVIALPDNRFLLTWAGGQAQAFDATG